MSATLTLTGVAAPAVAIDGLDLQVHPGEVVVLAGLDAPALSTVIRLAIGLASPTRGTVTLLGRELSTATLPELRHLRGRCGTLLAHGALISNLDIEANLGLALRYHGQRPEADVRSEVDDAISRHGLEALRHKRPAAVRKSDQRFVALVRACLGTPELLVLEEPLEGMKTVGFPRALAAIRSAVERGSAALLTTQQTDLEHAYDGALLQLPRLRVLRPEAV